MMARQPSVPNLMGLGLLFIYLTPLVHLFPFVISLPHVPLRETPANQSFSIPPPPPVSPSPSKERGRIWKRGFAPLGWTTPFSFIGSIRPISSLPLLKGGLSGILDPVSFPL